MNWDAIGAVGEILGAIAVVATLFYLASQIRHANRESQSNVAWAITNALNQFTGRITTSSDVASIWTRGCDDFYALNDAEQEHFVVLVAEWSNVFMALYRTKHLSPIPEGYWDQVKDTFLMYMEKPGFRACVMTRRVNFMDEVFEEITEGFKGDA